MRRVKRGAISRRVVEWADPLGGGLLVGVMGSCAMNCPILWAAIPGVWLEGNSTWHVQPHMAAQGPNPTGPYTLGELPLPLPALSKAPALSSPALRSQ